MAHIRVEIRQLVEIANDLRISSHKVMEVSDIFRHIIHRLDWEISIEEHIEKKSEKLVRKLDGCAETLHNYSSFLKMAFSKYEQLERYKNGIDNLSKLEVKSEKYDVRDYISPIITEHIIMGLMGQNDKEYYEAMHHPKLRISDYIMENIPPYIQDWVPLPSHIDISSIEYISNSDKIMKFEEHKTKFDGTNSEKLTSDDIF